MSSLLLMSKRNPLMIELKKRDESDDEPRPPQPPQQTPDAPVKEPPDAPRTEPDAPVREPDGGEPKRWG